MAALGMRLRMWSRTPHVASARRGVFEGAAGFLSCTSSSFPASRSYSRLPSPLQLTSQTSQLNTIKTLGVRHWHSSKVMSGENLEGQSPTAVRKYLQQSHDRIFESNRKWAEEQKAKHPEFFANLSAGQSPDYLWIGKSIALLRLCFSTVSSQPCASPRNSPTCVPAISSRRQHGDKC